MGSEIKSCPFCPSKSVSIHLAHGIHKYYAECNKCGSTGPYGDTEEEAKELWERATPYGWHSTVIKRRAARLLRPYMIHPKGMQEEEAILVFHFSLREAVQLGHKHLMHKTRLVDARGHWIREKFIFKYADKAKLMKYIPHVIANPQICSECGLWGSKIGEDGVGECCREEEE